MNFMSLNIRGMHDSHKVDWLKNLKKDHKFSFCGLQESRLSSTSPEICNWWGTTDVSYDFVNSIGQSGGIISFWDTSVFQAITVIKNRHFLAVVGNWHGFTGETILLMSMLLRLRLRKGCYGIG